MLEYSNIISYIFIIGAAQGLLLGVFLFKKDENRVANRLLAVLMVIFALDLLNGVAFLTGAINNFPWTIGLSNTFPYLYGPFIYLYVKILREGDDKFHHGYLLHAIPFIIVTLYGLFFFYFESIEYQLSLLDFYTDPPWHIKLVGNLIPVSGVIYIFLTMWEANRYNQKIKQTFSNIEKIKLSWAKHFVFGAILVWLIVFLAYLLNYLLGEETQANLLIYIAITILLYNLGIKALNQPEVHFEPISDQEDKPERYKKSGLADEIAEEILLSLENLMQKEKPYINSKLSLNDLAGVLAVSTHNLSEVINTKTGKNFYDYINSYRHNEVVRMLEDSSYDHFSILAIGLEAGFSSKSAYYKAFRKYTGTTPSKFKEELLENRKIAS